MAKAKLASGIYFPDQRRSSNVDNSKSPEASRVMAKLTHHRVKIDQSTKLLINGSEVLSHKGIKGNIHKVGVGFGTGRHTSGRRLDLLKEVPVRKEVAPLPMSLESADLPQYEPVASSTHLTPMGEEPMA